jgi:RNA polymerase sigma-70 factor (ECF subfamily)
MPEWQDQEINQLIEKAQNGDADSFGLIYEQYAEIIFRFTYSQLSNYQDAEDLTEEIFLRIWRSLPTYQQKGVPFVAYIFRIARNALIDHYRQAAHSRNQVPFEEELVGHAVFEPEQQAALNTDQMEIRAHLQELREDYRNVLILRFFSGLTTEETAEALGKSPGAVRVLQHRALASLKKLVTGHQRD